MRVGQVKLWPEKLQAAGATITACGLAFLSVALEGLVDSAVREGIEREEAFQMGASCMMGLSKLIASGESPTDVRKKVATPGGEFWESIGDQLRILTSNPRVHSCRFERTGKRQSQRLLYGSLESDYIQD